MFPGGGNMQQIMRQVQKMQKNVAKAQEEIAKMTVEGTAGGGAVKVTVTGDRRVTAVNLSPEVVDPDDVEMLQDLILAAINDGMKKAEELAEAEMKKVMPAGLPGFPGLF
ncbi:MAG: YbaB/EbfC family nucleoid-associated protein [Symbiobacterium sp.]|uniref:YbaB/EbfC family nucleoid-associated protein n=1 Tax=Symbiobacterium sp. TaxID=1971213 RepID=UPI0034642E5E